MLLTISFESHADFVQMHTACQLNNLEVMKTIILDKDSIVFYNLTSFIYIINAVLEKGMSARVHFINVD